MINSIASTSMSMSSVKLQQSVNIAMLKDVMDQQQASMQNLINNLSSATEGLVIDTYA